MELAPCDDIILPTERSKRLRIITPSLATRVLIETACQTPVRDRARTFNVMMFVFGAFAVTIVVLRLVFKQFFSPKKRLEMHDWPIVFAIPFAFTAIGITLGGLTAHGLEGYLGRCSVRPS